VTTAPTARPPAPLAAPLVARADLGDIAWQVLAHDGHLVPLTDDVGLPAGVRATPELRAAALGPALPPRCVVALGSAAWVHLGGRAPRGVQVVARRGERVGGRRLERVGEQRGVQGAERVVERRAAGGGDAVGVAVPSTTGAESDVRDRDVVLLGDVAVTTARRTAFDLLLRVPADAALPLVRALLDAGLLDLAEVRADVAAASGRRGVVAATRLLDVLARRSTLPTPTPPPTAPATRSLEVGPSGRDRSL
jgi:hypothetical protein